MKYKIVRVSLLALAAALLGCNVNPLGSASKSAAGAAATQGAATSAGSVASRAASSSSLTDMLVSQLGVTNQQAMGGAGAIFELAKSHMSPADFSKVSGAVPGMSQLLAAAPALSAMTGGNAGLAGTAASALGGGAGSLGSLATLGSAFSSLGMDAGMASKFLPVVLDFVQSSGGSATMSLLKAALL